MRTAPQKFVCVKPHIKAKDLGCPIPHFHIYIKGESLRVIEETRDEYTVKDGADHPWILKKSDVELVNSSLSSGEGRGEAKHQAHV